MKREASGPPDDLHLGSFSEDPPWSLAERRITWRSRVDDLRARQARQLPRLTRPPKLPPIGRALVVVAVLGRAVAGWYLRDRGTPRSKASLSKRFRLAAERLGPEGRAVHALLDNDDPEAVPELIAVLPAAIRAEIAALDLKRRDLSRLAADSVLIHGEDDPIIPETESQALARALPEGRVRLYLASNLMHADLTSGGTADGLALLPAAYRVLALRDEILENRTD